MIYNRERCFEKIMRETRNYKTKEELEKRVELLSNIPEFQMYMAVNNRYNQFSNEIVKSFYGENASKEVIHGEDLKLMSTGMKDKGSFHLEESGVAYAVAALYAKGMSLEENLDPQEEFEKKGMSWEKILNPQAELEKKRKAGLLVQEMASRGDDGRREMALLAVDAMRRLANNNYNKLHKDVMSNMTDLNAYFSMQMMFDLKRETEQSLNLKEAYEYKFRQENPNLSEEALAKKVQEAVAQTQSYAESYEDNRLYHELNESKISSHIKMSEALGVSLTSDEIEHADIDFQKNCFNKLYTDLLAVDPSYIRSSSEFRGMRHTVEEILKLYQNAGKMNELEFCQKLDDKCTRLADYQEKYLEKKNGIQTKEGSNAKKRLDFVRGASDFIKEARNMAANTNKMHKIAEIHSLKKAYNERQTAINDALKRCEDLVSPSTDKAHVYYYDKASEFMDACVAQKKEENNYAVPKGLGITEKQAGLLVMISVGTVEVSQINQNVPEKCDGDGKAYVSVAAAVEDICNTRDGYQDEKMQLIERGRGVVKHALEAYEQGDKMVLANMITEGMKRYTSTFTKAANGIVGGLENNIITAYKLAGDIYDMVSQNDELKKMLMDPALGENRITKETLEIYRAGKMTYELYQKAEKAKIDLLEMDFNKEKTPEQKHAIKEALAVIAFRNILNTEMTKSMQEEQLKKEKFLQNKYGDLLIEAEDPNELKDYEAESYVLEMKTPMGKVQRELTPQKLNACIQKLANSKTIERMVNSLDTSKLVTMFENEKEFFEKAVENIVKKEASVLKVEQKELQAEEKKNKVEDVQLSM